MVAKIKRTQGEQCVFLGKYQEAQCRQNPGTLTRATLRVSVSSQGASASELYH